MLNSSSRQYLQQVSLPLPRILQSASLRTSTASGAPTREGRTICTDGPVKRAKPVPHCPCPFNTLGDIHSIEYLRVNSRPKTGIQQIMDNVSRISGRPTQGLPADTSDPRKGSILDPGYGFGIEPPRRTPHSVAKAFPDTT